MSEISQKLSNKTKRVGAYSRVQITTDKIIFLAQNHMPQKVYVVSHPAQNPDFSNVKYLIFSKSYEIEIQEQIVLSFVRQGLRNHYDVTEYYCYARIINVEELPHLLGEINVLVRFKRPNLGRSKTWICNFCPCISFLPALLMIQMDSGDFEQTSKQISCNESYLSLIRITSEVELLPLYNQRHYMAST